MEHFAPNALSRARISYGGLGEPRSISSLFSALRCWLVGHFQLSRITVLTAN